MKKLGLETPAARGQFRPGAHIIRETSEAKRERFYHGRAAWQRAARGSERRGRRVMPEDAKGLERLLGLMFQAHPWHGIPPGEDAPEVVNAYVEIVPTDAVKYELDKASGNLRVDRPQRFSSFPPTLYGFVPQTFCGERVAELCRRAGRDDSAAIRGDGDPMDICVLIERPAAHADFLVRARPVGGLRMIDGSEADDKIIAVMENDVAYGYIEDISQAP